MNVLVDRECKKHLKIVPAIWNEMNEGNDRACYLDDVSNKITCMFLASGHGPS